ncbi:MAG: hypothetical protein V4502_08495 [Pseudomonadota bacterium]
MLILIAMFAAAGDVQAAPAPAPEKPKLICRAVERQLGSHMRGGRRCMTADEWFQDDVKRARIPVRLQVTAGQGDGQAIKTSPH